MLDWRTAGSIAPGVQRGSGLEKRPIPRERHDPAGGWRWTTCAEALLKGSGARALPDPVGAPPEAAGQTPEVACAISSAPVAARPIARALVVVILRQANARPGPRLRCVLAPGSTRRIPSAAVFGSGELVLRSRERRPGAGAGWTTDSWGSDRRGRDGAVERGSDRADEWAA